MRLEEAFRDFLEEQDYKGNSPATIKFYRENVGHFVKDTGATDLEDFSEQAIRSWLIRHRDVKRTTLRTYDRALRVFAHWLLHRGYVEADPMANLPKPRARTTNVETFSPGDVRGIMRAAKSSGCPKRDVAMLTLLLDTGIRARELADLTLEDVRWSEGWLSIEGKTGERAVPFGRRSKLEVKRYVDQGRKAASHSVRQVFLTRQGQPMRSSGVTKHVIRLGRRARLQTSKVGPHTFRHTFAVEFIRAGGDAFSLQRLLGHSTLDMTRRYVHLANGDLRTAHRRFGPVERML